jgi:phosphoglycerol transferase MdoB-like AlkP superfamily enzyme
MKQRLKYLMAYVIFWLAFFIACKLIFLFYHNSHSFQLSFAEWAGIFIHGLKLDFSATGYILIFPVVILIIFSIFNSKVFYFILNTYTIVILVFSVALVTIDLELYKYWGFRLDNTPLLYINKPEEMLASVRWYTIILALLFIAAVSFALIYLYLRYVAVFIRNAGRADILSSIIFLLILPSLIIPIRGGFGTSPVNISTAYFHENSFVNHASVNLLWNVGDSFTHSETKSNPFTFYDSETALNIADKLYNNRGETCAVLTSKRPNIIIVVLESFTSKLTGQYGRRKDITPNFNRLVTEGVFFSNFYASGSRSDKGLAAIISGYPAHGITSIMKFPRKTQTLPFISAVLAEHGYSTSFYYGGDIDFFNLRSYLINGGFRQIISEKDFPSSQVTTSWGVPDHIMFNRLFIDIDKDTNMPFFKVFFTLSNHEPFDIPAKTHFEGTDINSRMFNSAFYTDSCIGSFVVRARSSSWWDNTLIILVADHGSIYPDKTPVNSYITHEIPMLWIGGAIRTDTTISRYASQTDIPKTLLNQLGLPSGDFIFSRDILSGSYVNFAIYTFNNGFGYVSDSTKFAHDNVSGQVVVFDGTARDENIMRGRALIQASYEDFLNR